MAIKLTNKKHFISLGKKIKDYRGDRIDTLKIYKQYLILNKTKRPTISDIFPTHTVRSINYYLERFWTKEDAQKELTRIQGLRYVNSTVKELAVSKMLKTVSEWSPSEKERVSKLKAHNFKDPIKLAKYYDISVEEAVEKYADRVSKKVKKFNETLEKMGGYDKKWSCRCVEYWIARGYDLTEARDKVKSICDTRSISSIQERYNLNEEDAKLIQDKISDKCRDTFNARPQNEKDEILRKRTSFTGRYSKSSSSFFKDLMKIINIPKDFDIFVDDNEYLIWDYDYTTVSFYDFCIPTLKIIIEYNGIMFHPRVKDTIFTKVSDSVYRDSRKLKLAEKNDLSLFYFWEKIENREEALQKFKIEIDKRLYEYNIKENNN